uniref:LORF2 protein n=1 Tax=Toxocara canis TaxID=6265 RepID=A0A183UWB0_TOXCA
LLQHQARRSMIGSTERRLIDEEKDVRISAPPKFYHAYRTPKPLKRIFIKPRSHLTTQFRSTATIVIDTTTVSTTHSQQISNDDIDLVAICENVKTIAHNYRISNMPKFARNNCALIRLYYRNASCTDITTIVDYCFPEYASTLEQ